MYLPSRSCRTLIHPDSGIGYFILRWNSLSLPQILEYRGLWTVVDYLCSNRLHSCCRILSPSMPWLPLPVSKFLWCSPQTPVANCLDSWRSHYCYCPTKSLQLGTPSAEFSLNTPSAEFSYSAWIWWPGFPQIIHSNNSQASLCSHLYTDHRILSNPIRTQIQSLTVEPMRQYISSKNSTATP